MSTHMARKNKPSQPARPRIVRADGPAVETVLHVWLRPATDDHGRPITGTAACTKWTPLEAAYENGKLGEKGSSQAKGRYNAGKAYEKLWDVSLGSSTDSSQVLNISRSAISGGGDGKAGAALKDLEGINSWLGAGDRIIIKMVCGLGCFPSEAVAMVSAEYAKSTWPRFRESMDALVGALASFAKRGHINR